MTTAVEIYAGDFFKILEASSITKFSDICNRHFIKTAYYTPKISNVNLPTPYKEIVSNESP